MFPSKPNSAAMTPRPAKPAPPAPLNQKFNTMSNTMVKEFLHMRAQQQTESPVPTRKPPLPSAPSPARRSMPPTAESMQAAAHAVALAKMQIGDYPPPLPASFSFPKPPPPLTAPVTPLPPPPPPTSVAFSIEHSESIVIADDRLMTKKVAMLEIEVENLQKRLELKEQYILSMKRVHERTEKQLQDKLDEALRTIQILEAVGQFNPQH